MAVNQTLRSLGRDSHVLVGIGLALAGITVAASTMAPMPKAESATPRLVASTGSAGSAEPAAASSSRPAAAHAASVLDFLDSGRATIGADPLTVTSCAMSAARDYAAALPPVVPASGSGWPDAMVLCHGNVMSFGFRSGHDKSGVVMASAEIAADGPRSGLLDAAKHEFGDTILSVGGPTQVQYVLAWAIG